MNRIISENIEEIRCLCLKYKVKRMFVFGSVCSEDFNDQSDIDFLISFEHVPIEDYADNFFDLLFQLRTLLKREIDITSEKSLTNPYFIKEIEQKKQLIYAA